MRIHKSQTRKWNCLNIQKKKPFVTLPLRVKIRYVHFSLQANYFLLPWEIPEEISRQSKVFNKYRQYLPYQTCRLTNSSIQPFTMRLDWPGCLMEVSIMFDIYTWCFYFVQHNLSHDKSCRHKSIVWQDLLQFNQQYDILLCIIDSIWNNNEIHMRMHKSQIRNWNRLNF